MITLELTETEFATMIDCTPGIYNKLPKGVQELVSEMRDTQQYFGFENKAVAAALASFKDPGADLMRERYGIEPTPACIEYGHWRNPHHGHCNRCTVEC